MKKILLEILLSAAVVFIPTYILYGQLANIPAFWNSQYFWSVALGICWVIVAGGYFHQGWLIRKTKTSADVSLVLPVAVFFVQCILFVKGVHYNDTSLIWGAVLVNSGVTFSVFAILRAR